MVRSLLRRKNKLLTIEKPVRTFFSIFPEIDFKKFCDTHRAHLKRERLGFRSPHDFFGGGAQRAPPAPRKRAKK